MKSFISLEEAIEILNENVKILEVEEVQLIDALDKVLAEDVYSVINNPPFNKSAMDGYAVMYEDTNHFIGFINNYGLWPFLIGSVIVLFCGVVLIVLEYSKR